MFCIYEVVSLKSFVRASDSKEAILKGFTEHMAGVSIEFASHRSFISYEISSLLVSNHMITNEV
jgi:hypothetical protein